MKYMIMMAGSQRDYDMLTGKQTGEGPAWTPEDIGAMHEFMGNWNQELVESGEFVDGPWPGRAGAHPPYPAA